MSVYNSTAADQIIICCVNKAVLWFAELTEFTEFNLITQVTQLFKYNSPCLFTCYFILVIRVHATLCFQ